ncbi:MAG TPA: hypothetical protein VIG07_04535 [Methylomirabilota bacterium]|jgi:hypothetical protein
MSWRRLGGLLGVALLCMGVGPALAHDPNPILQAIPANTALDLGPYTCRSPEDDPSDCVSITAYSRFVYDRLNHQILMFGGGHAATHRTDVDVFDFSTLTWGSAYPSTPCSQMRLSNLDRVRGGWTSTGHPLARHTYDMLVMADNIKRLLVLGSPNGHGGCPESPPGKDQYFFDGKIAMYDPVAKTWSYSKAGTDGWEDFGTAEYDPVSGLVVVMDHESVWTYNPVTQAKTPRVALSFRGLGYAKNLVYFPPTRRMYYIADGNLIVEIDLGDGPSVKLRMRLVDDIKGDVPQLAETGFAYDPVNRIIGGGVLDGFFYAFDPVARRWTRQRMTPQPAGAFIGAVSYHTLDYDPVNHVFIFLTRQESDARTWAFRYSPPAK